MPGLSTQEHRTAQREAKDRRNAGQRHGRASLARAWAWVQAVDAEVVCEAVPTGGLLYTVRVPGFHSQSAQRLPDAVAALQGNIDHYCESRARTGPTGAKLDRLRAVLERMGVR